jgi:predicted glycosyltransferase
MKIIVDINHPAHVHYFKNFIWEMERKGHEILITATEKDITYHLLNNYGFDYINMGRYGDSLIRKLMNIPVMDLKMYRAVKSFKPDIFLGFGSIRAAHVSKLLRKPGIAFDDDEYSYPYYHRFVDAICGFSGFKKDEKKIVKVNGYKELAYLHPNWFYPNFKVRNELGVSKEEDFILLRFVGWKAYHDVGRSGFDLEKKRKLIKELEKYSSVFVSSEVSLPKELEKYRLPISPEKIHNFLYCARLLICDSQTMTTEAGVLGTPVIRCNSFVGENDMGNFIELEQKYGLIFNFNDPDKAINKAIELIQKPYLKEEWKKKRENLLKDKIDVTAFMVWFIENYPESFKEMKENPEIQYRFK